MQKEIKKLEQLLNEKVAEDRLEEYQKYKKIKGATQEDFNKLESKYDIVLSEEFKEFYKYKNGSGYHFHIFYSNCEENSIIPFYLYSIDEIMKEDNSYHELMSEYFDEDEIARLDKCIKPYIQNKNWIPFATLAGGSLYLMLDYDPSAKGKKGQIIVYVHDPDYIYYVASDFKELLINSNKNLEIIDWIDY